MTDRDIKKSLLVLPGILLLSCSLTAYSAAKCAQVKGNMEVGKVTLGCTVIEGSATFKNSTFTGKLDITGPLKADSSKLADLKVAGKVTLDKSVVEGSADIMGDLTATNTVFKKKLQITSLSATLSGSTTQDIKIISSKSHETSYLYLKEGSTVNGDITFTRGKGVVKNNHSTLKGKVIGGKVE